MTVLRRSATLKMSLLGCFDCGWTPGFLGSNSDSGVVALQLHFALQLDSMTRADNAWDTEHRSLSIWRGCREADLRPRTGSQRDSLGRAAASGRSPPRRQLGALEWSACPAPGPTWLKLVCIRMTVDVVGAVDVVHGVADVRHGALGWSGPARGYPAGAPHGQVQGLQEFGEMAGLVVLGIDLKVVHEAPAALGDAEEVHPGAVGEAGSAGGLAVHGHRS